MRSSAHTQGSLNAKTRRRMRKEAKGLEIETDTLGKNIPLSCHAEGVSGAAANDWKKHPRRKAPSPQRGNNQDYGSGLREPLQDDKFVYVVCEQTTHNPQPTTHNLQQKTKNRKQTTGK